MTVTPGTSAPPRISLVTPCLNQAAFLEQSIRSILDQRYPNLEYVMVDGGSTDGSLEIIKKYADHFAWWTSEPDRGQYDAINKGFAHCTGEIMAWLNADDKYLPWTFSTLAHLMTDLPQVEWVTSTFHLFWDEHGRAVSCESHPGFSSQLVLRGGTLPGAGWPAWAFIQQESTFWRRSLWDRTGGQVDTQWSLAADFDLWMRFAQRAELYSVPVPLAGFRRHAGQKTAMHMQEYVRQARASFQRHGGRPPVWLKGLWLKNWGKIVRFLQRRHAYAATQQGLSNHCVFSADENRWQLRQH